MGKSCKFLSCFIFFSMFRNPPSMHYVTLFFPKTVCQNKVDNFWNLQDPKIQHLLLADLLFLQPFFVMLSPPCTHLCQYMFSNWGKMDPLTKYELLHQAIGHIDVSCWVATIQAAAKSYYCIENPEGSQAWNRANVSCCQTVVIKMCVMPKFNWLFSRLRCW